MTTLTTSTIGREGDYSDLPSWLEATRPMIYDAQEPRDDALTLPREEWAQKYPNLEIRKTSKDAIEVVDKGTPLNNYQLQLQVAELKAKVARLESTVGQMECE